MIVNLWSTPRTGSVRYSFILQKKYPGAKLITELFNRYHMNLYHKDEEGKVLNLHEYQSGNYYKSYYIKDGILYFKKAFEERIRTVDEEELYRINLLNDLDPHQTYIFHNHVSPINQQVLETLTNMAEKNVYMYRIDKRQQLASYVIAYSTKQFALFHPALNSSVMVEDVNKSVLENLIDRIKVWDFLPKKGNIISYEESLKELVQVPVYKQNYDHNLRLSSNMQKIIEDVVIDYENNIAVR